MSVKGALRHVVEAQNGGGHEGPRAVPKGAGIILQRSGCQAEPPGKEKEAVTLYLFF